ncbi:MAG TPA: ABC transporter permease [Acidimicrobiales bacterium]|nr:ABC transporter permease [Acidimicrobiales bacterium]
MALPTEAVPLRRFGALLDGRARSIRLKGNLAMMIPLGILLLMVLACFFGPALFHLPAYQDGNLANANLGLGQQGHLLGTDPLGNDLLSRSLVGGRVSIEVGLGATLAGVLIGSNLGMLAGYFGGALDTALMRLIDVQLAFPALILALIIAEYLGPSEFHEGIALTVLSVPNYARLSRAGTLRIREREFVVATRIMGARRRHITLRHIYPNIVPSLITIFPITVSVVMLVEATLSFLGAGIRPPAPSWGNMVYAGTQYLETAPINVIVPGAFLFVTVCCLNLVGEQVRARFGR